MVGQLKLRLKSLLRMTKYDIEYAWKDEVNYFENKIKGLFKICT